MRKNYKALFQLSAISVFATLSFSNLGMAEKIYTWKDESGRTHYTDNPALIPLKKDAQIIKMQPIPIPPEPEPVIDGKALWESNCTQCHHIDPDSFKGNQGIPNLIADIQAPSSTPESRLRILQDAIDGDMDNNIKSLKKLSINERKAIIKYLTEQVNLKFPQQPENPK